MGHPAFAQTQATTETPAARRSMSVWEYNGASFNDNTPIYSQIIALLTRSFARGEIKPGERIPSIRELALKMKVNANTAQRVYQEMERDGLIESRRGTGYFFTEDYEMVEKMNASLAGEAIKAFLTEMRALGYSDGQIIETLKNRMEGGEKDDG